MATIKVFDVNGCKTLQCFDTLDEVPYLTEEEVEEEEIVEDKNPFE